ncbi:MAG TPA: mechanosensitive ion channel family protein [Candidatus Cloacimonetes bacterium]|nr:mechanosensitive ion channel family protein [Candidatus Cloacimonadota bacterium]HEX38310.1 mechanosensitive ion channel family protein [Candidatus Cloacimonadota bacterium]
MLDTIVWGKITVLQLIIAIGIFIISIIVSKILSMYVRRSLKNKASKDNLEIMIKIISYAIMIIGLIWALSVVGLKLSGLLVAGGIMGIVIGFASQSIVGNLISGIFLMIERPIRIGDTVNINGSTGIIEDIRIISTTIRTFDGYQMRIPNEKVFTANISNFVANVVRRFEYDVGIRYNDDADKAITIIKELLDKEPFALKNPEPLVWVNKLSDNAVNINVKIWAPISEWWALKTSMLWRIKKALEVEGIEIAFPQRVLWFGDSRENNDTLPVVTSEKNITQ